jgi:hypothetical protein
MPQLSNPLGDPPALPVAPAEPVRQQKFDIFRSVLHPPLLALEMLPTSTCTSTTMSTSTLAKTVIDENRDRDVHVLVDVIVDGFWLRSGTFEGPATIKPPAFPADIYFKPFIPALCAIAAKPGIK